MYHNCMSHFSALALVTSSGQLLKHKTLNVNQMCEALYVNGTTHSKNKLFIPFTPISSAVNVCPNNRVFIIKCSFKLCF